MLVPYEDSTSRKRQMLDQKEKNCLDTCVGLRFNEGKCLGF